MAEPSVIAPENLETGRMTLVEHLTELRRRLIVSVAAVLVGAVVCWLLYDYIFDFMVTPYCESLSAQARAASQLLSGDESDSCALIQTNPTEGLSIHLTVAGYGGLTLALPLVLWQVWRFIAPGLYSHERRYAIPFILSGVGLFLLGGGLAFWTLPQALDWLNTVGGPDLVTVYSPGPYLSFVVKMVVGFGLGFELPLILVFLQMLGIVKSRTLRAGRSYAIVGIVALGAVLTPSGDPFTLFAISIPLCVLYEISVLVGRMFERRRESATT